MSKFNEPRLYEEFKIVWGRDDNGNKVEENRYPTKRIVSLQVKDAKHNNDNTPYTSLAYVQIVEEEREEKLAAYREKLEDVRQKLVNHEENILAEADRLAKEKSEAIKKAKAKKSKKDE